MEEPTVTIPLEEYYQLRREAERGRAIDNFLIQQHEINNIFDRLCKLENVIFSGIHDISGAKVNRNGMD